MQGVQLMTHQIASFSNPLQSFKKHEMLCAGTNTADESTV